jgi:hypothetical protein
MKRDATFVPCGPVPVPAARATVPSHPVRLVGRPPHDDADTGEPVDAVVWEALAGLVGGVAAAAVLVGLLWLARPMWEPPAPRGVTATAPSPPPARCSAADARAR